MPSKIPRHRNGNHDYTLPPRLRILLTNGRFPVAVDLARQLWTAGHVVFVVDPMQYHVCKFSIAVHQSKQVPAPHDDASGYIAGVKEMAVKWHIDLIIPVHEEIFFLAECEDREILDRLFAPPFDLLIRLHNKNELFNLIRRMGLDVPSYHLCRTGDDVRNLPLDKYEHGLALKPCFGRSSVGVHHLKPGEPLPSDEELDIGEHNHYVAQEWLKGCRYCSYSVVRDSRVVATGLYPVLETIDGSSSVYFQQKSHKGIYSYIEDFVGRLRKIGYTFSGQLAFDFVEIGERLVIIDCNPRSTSGLHLWTDTPYLARALTNSLSKETDLPIVPPETRLGHPSHVQVGAGMLMWEHKQASFGVWAKHIQRLMGTRDIVWKTRDAMPTIAQPFLLTKYYQMCRQTGLQLPELFQQHVLWEPQYNTKDPKGSELEKVRKLMAAANDRDERRIHGEKEGETSEDDIVEELEKTKKRVRELESENRQLAAVAREAK